MKKLTDSKGLGTCLRFAFLVSAFGIANFVRAEYAAERQSPPSGPEVTSQSLAYDLNATSQNNALATPDGGRGDVIPGRTSLPPASDALPRSAINKLIVQMINKMPQGGEYHASSESTQKLASAIRVQGDNLDIHPDVAMPSFCSSATYLLFVSVLDNLNKNKQLTFERGVAEKLRVNGQRMVLVFGVDGMRTVPGLPGFLKS